HAVSPRPLHDPLPIWGSSSETTEKAEMETRCTTRRGLVAPVAVFLVVEPGTLTAPPRSRRPPKCSPGDPPGGHPESTPRLPRRRDRKSTRLNSSHVKT